MTVYIFGEAHTSEPNREYIASRIRELKPKFILHELLYSDEALTLTVIKQRLAKCKVNGTCDPRLNKDIYELGLEVGSALIGIDTEVSTTDLKRQFQQREEHMFNMINKYLTVPYNVVAVVGDIHLRERDSLMLGEASILNQLKGKVVIERAPVELREAK